MALLIPIPRPARRRLFWSRLLLLVLLGWWGAAEKAAGQTISREHQLKAVLLYNLTQFIDWPKTAFATGEPALVIGILGDDPFKTVLDEAVRGERSNDRPIVVKRFATPEEALHCQVLFVSASRKSQMPEILARLQGRPILTVADSEGFIRHGGIIRMTQNPDNKIRLKINLETAKANNLVISAKLLRVAEIVRPKED